MSGWLSIIAIVMLGVGILLWVLAERTDSSGLARAAQSLLVGTVIVLVVLFLTTVLLPTR